MAHDSTQRTRIIPAIPLNFKKKQSIKSPPTQPTSTDLNSALSQKDVEQTNHIGQPSAPLAVNAPLTPESIPSVPAQDEHFETLQAKENKSQSGAEQAAEAGTEVGHDHDATRLSEGLTSATPVSTSQHRQAAAQILFGEQNTVEQPRDGHIKPRYVPNGITHPSSAPEDPTSPVASDQVSNGVQTDGKKHEQSQQSYHTRPNVDGLVFGSVGNELLSSAVTFASPPRHHHSSRNSLMANNVNAAPFFPAATGSLPIDLQSPASFSPIDAPPFQPFSPVQPWYSETYPLPATPMHYSQPMSPSMSHHSSTRAGQRSSDFQSIPNGHVQHVPLVVDDENRNGDTVPLISESNGSTVPVALQDYILSQFGQLNFADCLLEFQLSTNTFSPISFPAHRLLAARSPRLASELVLGSPGAEFDPFGLRIVRIWARSRHVTPKGISYTLRYLYGSPLPHQELLSAQSSGQDSFLNSLGLAAAGGLLELPDVESHGLAMAKEHLSWEVLEQAYAYLHETTDVSAVTELCNAVLSYVAQNFPKDFILDTKAPQLVDAPRLPELSGSRPSTSDPRLSHIQFGDVDESSPQPDHQILVSSILLSLPFDDLKKLFAHEDLRRQVGPSNLGHLQQAVVDERERRRIKAQRAKRRSSAPSEPQDAAVFENLQWIEGLDHSFDGSLILSRSRKDDNSAT